MTEPELDLSVIIVSWNVRDLLRACLASLRASPGISWCGRASATPVAPGALSAEAIVVDNGSGDASAEMVAREFPWVRLIANDDNRGFTGGNNQGLAASRSRYVLLLNPDAEVVGDAVRTMVAYLEQHPAVGALGPELRYGDGTLQSSRRRFPTLAMAMFESTPLSWHWPTRYNPWARRFHMADCQAPKEGQPVDWVVGAALLIRREVLDAVGAFDEGYFMYSEELDWCRRAAGAGWATVYLPAAVVIHHEGRSSEQAPAVRHIRFQTSKVRYFRKFNGAIPATLLRLGILSTCAVEWLLEALKWLAASKRPLRRSRMAAYKELLRSGLRS